MLVRSAPAPLVMRALGGDVLRVGWAVRSGLAPLRQRHRPTFRTAWEQTRALLSFGKIAPGVALDRVRSKPSIPRESLLHWMVSK